jgi:hypothetical protein
MRLASYVLGELIPGAFVWLHPGITPCCKWAFQPFPVRQRVSGLRHVSTGFQPGTFVEYRGYVLRNLTPRRGRYGGQSAPAPIPAIILP